MARSTGTMVRQIDRAVGIGITVGGVGIIAAVLVIMLYLAWNVAPLFSRGSLSGERTGKVAFAGPVVGLVADEYKGMLIAVLADGRAQAVDLTDFAVLAPFGETAADKTVTAVSAVNEYGQLAIGYDDGSVQIGSVSTKAEFIDPGSLDAADPGSAKAAKLIPGERTRFSSGYAEMTGQGQLRVVTPQHALNRPADLDAGSGKVVRIDFRSTSSAQFLVAAREDGTIAFSRVSIVRPLGGGKPRASLESVPVAYVPPAGYAKVPDRLFVTGDGSHVLAVWLDGTIARYALATGAGGEGERFELAETVDLLEGERRIESAQMLLGSKTLIIGDDTGRVIAAFAAKTDTVRTPDGWQFVTAHTVQTGALDAAAVSAVGIALRDRSVVIGDRAGRLTVRHVTSEKLVAELPPTEGQAGAVVAAGISPKGDGVFALTEGGSLTVADLDPGHAEVSIKSLFGKVWYEGDPGPSFTYQASTGEDTAETKYSKVPLIFGTLKSTLYAMLFAVPLAIMAALYTSEFLHPKVKNRVKPVIEMMASLPSVVLGFLASIIIAPLFRDYLPGVLMAFFVIPVGILAAAYLWQLVPVRVASRMTSLMHLACVLVVVLVSGAAALGLGRVMERTLFSPSEADMLVLAGSVEPIPREQYPEALRDKRSLTADMVLPYRSQGLYYAGGAVVRPKGSVNDPSVAATIAASDLARPDMRLWLDGLIGTPRAGWVVLLTPLGVIGASMLRARLVDQRLLALPFARIGTAAAATEIAKFLATLSVGFGLAGIGATLLTWAGLDARDSIIGGFTQRNTLVVGIAMGFAIIPIIYTISEDSLSAVPGQLRSASLGCGATRWQTATRVVLPIALSGIFSAVMIGLGRAAGETMIVLMATGNTPNMDWNIFSGFRTLAANIATEMPEAPVGSTHYRVLFLGALCLFALTFLVNTLAEVVRQRVRRARAAL